MKCKILHESKGRIRVHLEMKRMRLIEAELLDLYFRSKVNIADIKVYDRTCDAVIFYSGDRAEVIRLLSRFSFSMPELSSLLPVPADEALNGEHSADIERSLARTVEREYEEKLVLSCAKRIFNKIFIPQPIRTCITIFRSVKYLLKGLSCLLSGRIEVPVLDATAIAVSMIRRDFDTASSIMFLLGIGEILEDWTHKKSVNDLARTMSLNVDKVWAKTTLPDGSDGPDVLVKTSDLLEGDRIVIRTGGMIPVDGTVLDGEGSVNQSSMTGESMPVHKKNGSRVYAGTAVEDGELLVRVDKVSGAGRYDRIVNMIEESEKLKSTAEDKASHLADSLVPWSLGATALTYLITKNPAKALAILMVDFSCALKLAMPISVLSGIRDCRKFGITVKGGKFMEAAAEADTLVFDKTGTLTKAEPRVYDVIPFSGNSRDDVLRLAACLEEHYPHSIANAVVAKAKDENLIHDETHSTVQYIVAHGISSSVDGEKVVIGSYHFVFQDEGCYVPYEETEKFLNLSDEYSHLYLAVSGVLAAVILIEDPLREEAAEVISRLHELGIRKIVMMTGDSKKTAAAVAAKVGVDEFYSEVLPEDKAAFIVNEHKNGRKVIMTGDGVNDSPALSESDAGIAISSGAAIAREIADITISADDLWSIVRLREISSLLMKRINTNYRTIMGFNGSLIALGVAGVLQPSASAFLHNASTLAIGLRSMTDLM